MGCLKILHSEQKSALSKNWKVFVGGVEKSVSSKKNRINYYPFGMTMPGRSFSSPSYRYGFNGKEKDDELKGSGNHLDFGARGYDPRLGRWFAIDAFFAKYPGTSPYVFVANNPILNREVDGNDYVISINHETKVITITSTLYVKNGAKNSHNRALKATVYWNSQSDKFQYKVGKGKKAVYYDIKINISVKESDDPKGEVYGEQTIVNAESGGSTTEIKGEIGANSFEIMEDKMFQHTKKQLGATDLAEGLTVGGNMIVVPENTKGGEGTVDNHEVGHTLGLDHFEGTTMHTSTAGGLSKVTIPMIQAILGKAGVTTNYYEDAVSVSKTKTNTEGKEPVGFSKGNVRKSK